MNKTYQVHKPEDFRLIIRDVLDKQRLGANSMVIALQGDLGAGKTTFTQILAKELGVTELVTSPTFTIMKQYEVTNEQFDRLVHIDAYRIESELETQPLRLAEVFQKPRTLVCVEWSERIPGSIPMTAVLVSIKIKEQEIRTVTVQQEVG